MYKKAFYRSLLIGLLCMSFMPQDLWARWLWIPGEHKGETGCEKAVQEMQRRLSTALNERLKANLNIDGQILSCQSTQCAQSRMIVADAQVGVLTQSQCFKNALEFEVVVVSDQQQNRSKSTQQQTNSTSLSVPSNEHTYRSRITKQSDQQFSSNHLALASIKVAEKLIKGPRPFTPQKTPPSQWYSASIGYSNATSSRINGQGLSVQLQWTYLKPHTLTEWSFVGEWSQQQSPIWSDQIWAFGGVWRSHWSRKGLSPFIGVGVHLLWMRYQEEMLIQSELSSSLKSTQFYRNRAQNLGIEPSLESGLFWWGNTLHPYLSVSLRPFMIGSPHSSTRLLFMGGVRW